MLALTGFLVSLGAFAGGSASSTALHVVVSVLALIMCITVHEFGHALVADRLGDPLPRAQGRVTLNPLHHIDLLGTVIFPALMAMGVAVPLAWGKPVEWTGQPRYLTRRFSMRTIRFFVAVAGPGMNLGLALLISLLLIGLARLGILGPLPPLGYLIQLNLGLLFFNLLPVPPLDGRVFLEFLPEPLAPVRDLLTRYGSFIFLGLILLGGVSGASPLALIMRPFYQLTALYMNLVVSLAGL